MYRLDICRLIKPLGGYLGKDQEQRDLATAISRDIYVNNPNVRWDDIVGKSRSGFLGATKHLYNWLCPLVGWSVGRLVGNASICRTLLAYLALFLIHVQ